LSRSIKEAAFVPVIQGLSTYPAALSGKSGGNDKADCHDAQNGTDSAYGAALMRCSTVHSKLLFRFSLPNGD
jgi:hypothetical protein